MKFGDLLSKWLYKKEKRAADLAYYLGVTRAHVYNWIQNKNHPRPGNEKGIMKFLGVTESGFWGLAEESTTKTDLVGDPLMSGFKMQVDNLRGQVDYWKDIAIQTASNQIDLTVYGPYSHIVSALFNIRGVILVETNQLNEILRVLGPANNFLNLDSENPNVTSITELIHQDSHDALVNTTLVQQHISGSTIKSRSFMTKLLKSNNTSTWGFVYQLCYDDKCIYLFFNADDVISSMLNRSE